MQRIRNRLLAGAPFWLFLCSLPVLVFFCWNLAIYGKRFITWLVPDIYIASSTRNLALQIQDDGVQGVVLRTIIWAPLREEFLFRVFPFGLLFLVWGIFRKSVPPLWLAIALVLLTSVVFGNAHGALGNFFTQGLVGLVIALVFLVWGSYGRTPIKGICAILLLHVAYNVCAVVWVQQNLHQIL
ncbi:MAG: hypothetical protein QG636_539 [Patescibacteria group bacterium]|jgi:membrane protease YdiL (CAAX protease family)|nr:hypothetical protein [Patescibacteria group bacterium]